MENKKGFSAVWLGVSCLVGLIIGWFLFTGSGKESIAVADASQQVSSDTVKCGPVQTPKETACACPSKKAPQHKATDPKPVAEAPAPTAKMIPAHLIKVANSTDHDLNIEHRIASGKWVSYKDKAGNEIVILRGATLTVAVSLAADFASLRVKHTGILRTWDEITVQFKDRRPSQDEWRL